LPFYNFYQRLANSNTTKEALKCTASISADSIVNAISFITGVLFCDPKTSFSQIQIRLQPDFSSQIRPDPAQGLMEFAGVDKAARSSKMGVWKMQEWTNQHDMARVDFAGVDIVAPLWQGWTMQEEKTCPS